MTQQSVLPVDTRRFIRRAEALRNRLLRRTVFRGLRRILAIFVALRAAAELRAMDEQELHDLGLGRSEIAHAIRHGRDRH